MAPPNPPLPELLPSDPLPLVAEHRGRECFRVFWGRYATVEEARAAKSSVPRFFFTPTNVPAVIATRPLLP